jgi:hypothetical protein
LAQAAGVVIGGVVPACATLRLHAGPDTLWVAAQPLSQHSRCRSTAAVAAQPLKTTAFFQGWTDSLAALPHISRTTIGTPPRGRLLHILQFGDEAGARHVLIVSRPTRRR